MKKTFSNKLFLVTTLLILIFITTLFMIFQVYLSKQTEENLSREQIVQAAKIHFQSIVDMRDWNSQFGGVYVKGDSGLKPNPYLKNGTLKIDSNETMIQINPAWMTRQISMISSKRDDYQFNITSLKPLNPDNKVNTFEKKALDFFEKNKNEKFYYNFNNKADRFDLMGSLEVKESCLKCHAHQGYKLGDVRGGIRISLPLNIYKEQAALTKQRSENHIIIIILSAIALFGASFWGINIFYKRQYEIEHANEILEEKVKIRTKELEEAVYNEQHLKDLLQTITEVNEMLVTTFSIKSILKSSGEKLYSNKSYPLVITGLINDDLLEIVYETKKCDHILSENIVSLKVAEKTCFLSHAIKKAIDLKHPIVEKAVCQFFQEGYNRRKDDVDVKWVMVLPLLHGFDKKPYGMITVFTSAEDGFELEEMKILENMAQDISIALNSHKQRDAILSMEKEKTANYEETILAFVHIIEQRDTYTAGHTIRVAEYCALIARQMGYNESDIHRLEKAAILHDIGKVATPDTILLKPGKLSHIEYELIKQHSAIGADMLEKITMYKNLADIIRYHHSRYDGNGYPKTSSPDEIPMLSHILIVADAFDAMTTNRIYRPRKSIDEALSDLEKNRGIQFHPDVIDAAKLSLKDINVTVTSQSPISELEKKRMSYFFIDRLTGLYNEDYVKTYMNTKNMEQDHLAVINLHNFGKYNKQNGWNKGSALLRNIALMLQELYPNSTLIRYQGDDFMILHKSEDSIKLEDISENELIKDSIITVSITDYEIEGTLSVEKLNEIEDDMHKKC